MPQLDKLIILNQLKVFIIIFILIYLLFFLFVFPKINISLRIRRDKLKNILNTSTFIKSLRISFFFNYKNYFFYSLNTFELLLEKNWFFLKNSVKNVGNYLFYYYNSLKDK